MGLCLLAAANPHGEFLGVDFLPEHVDHGRAIAEAAGLTNIRFSDGDFVALAADWPTEFGQFDYVTLHGVYSWITPMVREALVRCLGQATKPTGLVYIGYNAQPGWLGTVPFRHISRLIKDVSGQPSDVVLQDSIALFDRLATGGATSFQILPGLKARLAAVKRQSSNYLIHEYLHEGWHPLWH
jgi:SAM-dependent methyltransferase